MKLNELGALILNDGWLCPRVPRDDLGSGGEAIVAMAETLQRYETDMPCAREPTTVPQLVHTLSAALPHVTSEDHGVVKAGYDAISAIRSYDQTRRIGSAAQAA